MESHGYPGKYRLVIGKDQSYFTQDGKLVVAVSGSQAARLGMEASVLLTKVLHNLVSFAHEGFSTHPGCVQLKPLALNLRNHWLTQGTPP